MKVMCDTNDGFKISEKDLELRGSGDFFLEQCNMACQNSKLQICLKICQYCNKYNKLHKNILSKDTKLEK